MNIARDTGLAERESETLILNPAILNDGTPAPGGLVVPGYPYRLPIQGHVWRCRSLSVLTGEQYNPQGLSGAQVVLKATAISDWVLTLLSPDSRVIVKELPLAMFLRNYTGLTNRPAFRYYFADDTYFDARQSYATFTNPNAKVPPLIPFRFIYA